MDGNGFASRDGDGLQTLPAQNRAQAGASGGPLIGDDACVCYKIFTGGADAEPAELFLVHKLGQFLLTFGCPGSPEVAGIVENELILVDLQPLAAIAPALQDQGIEACLFQVEAEAAAAVGGGQDTRLGGQGRDIEPGGTGRAGTGEGTGGNNHPVFFRKGGFLAGQMIAENPGSHDLTA